MRAGGDHVGRHGDDGGAGGDRALRRLHRDVAARVDRGRRRRQFDRDPLGERGEQRAESLPAERVDIALGGSRRSRRPRPAPGPCRSRTGRARIRSVGRQSPRSFGSACAQETSALRAASAMARLARTCSGQKILKLAFARVAPADAHLLARRRRIDFDAARGAELRHRIEIGHVDPVRAAVVRHAEGARIGDAAAADMVGRFDAARTAGRRRRSGARRRCRPRPRRR